ncbi:MAG: hypothetical protein JNK82_08170 [Myxococcaceae bacterium]|nr:hypothetical protein [Myxococcaceae bacterium]
MRRLALTLLFVLSACSRIEQSPECARYMACVEAIMAGASVAYEGSYGVNGTCWSTNQNDADTCTLACIQGRQNLSAGFGQGKAECQ